MSDQPTVVYESSPPDSRPTPPPIPDEALPYPPVIVPYPPAIVPNPDDSQPTYFTNPSKPIIPTKPTLPTGGGGGSGGGDSLEPAKLPSTQFSSDSATTTSQGERPQQTITSSQQQTRSPSSAADNGGVTLRPGAPTSFRNALSTTTSSSAAAGTAPGISGSVISGPMTAVVFTFAFLGALIIGLVAGFLIAKYTHLGGSRKRKEQKDQLTEQLRLLTESIDQRNEYNHRLHQHHPQERPLNLDRSYLQEDKLSHAPYQAELAPLYMNRSYAAYPTTTTTAVDPSHPHSITDQHYLYQNWDSAGALLMTSGTPMVSIRPTIVPTSAAQAAAAAAASRTPRLGDMATTLLPPDIEIDGPKDEWVPSRAGSTISLR
ncbi:hypothetical protein BG015_011920 [Linnemannia schmuckeri]|uniref:Uncharacterized protein n=1 Tax=Linnemannia schmuckeri TaxID=64567 RepID=A0A9P5VEE0_9FUNG|nr:hypothetical protein BG015_011920 [Linnemannia schmuckeri]